MVVDLAAVIKQIESSGNQFAIRFEPLAFKNWNWVPAEDRIKAKHHCSDDTARMIGCTSWGFYQLMGVNIFEQQMADDSGFDPPTIVAFLNDAGLQTAMFHAFLKLKGIDWPLEDLLADSTKLHWFANIYNGPGDVDVYSANIVATAKRLQTGG